MKKTLIILLTALIFVSLFSGCKKKDESESYNPEIELNTKKIEETENTDIAVSIENFLKETFGEETSGMPYNYRVLGTIESKDDNTVYYICKWEIESKFIDTDGSEITSVDTICDFVIDKDLKHMYVGKYEDNKFVFDKKNDLLAEALKDTKSEEGSKSGEVKTAEEISLEEEIAERNRQYEEKLKKEEEERKEAEKYMAEITENEE